MFLSALMMLGGIKITNAICNIAYPVTFFGGDFMSYLNFNVDEYISQLESELARDSDPNDELCLSDGERKIGESQLEYALEAKKAGATEINIMILD